MKTDLNSGVASNAVTIALHGISNSLAEISKHIGTLAASMENEPDSLSQGATVGTIPDIVFFEPTFDHARDAKNKDGVRLTDRGIEIIYRMYDAGKSIRGASKAMDISPRAAKWRHGAWEKAGGLNRRRLMIDGIDRAAS